MMGKHEYSGYCRPINGISQDNFQTFSVGIYELIPKSSGKGFKKSAVKVRVRGNVSDEKRVYEMAQNICKMLDHGEYVGPKIIWAK